MATEIELKLALSSADARALPQHPLLAGIPYSNQRLLNTYYDTPELDLKARRIALRFRKKGWQWLLTVKSAEPASGGLAVRNEWETQATPGLWDFKHVDAPDLRALLESRTADLVPIFTTDFRRRAWVVEFGSSSIEVALDRGHVQSQGRRAPLCEVELELISGDIADIFALTRLLQETLHLRPSVASKAERGYALFGDEALRPFRARLMPLNAKATPVEAFRQIALACLEQLQRNEAGIIASGDPEFVHQARVALRRLRSALKLFAPALPQEFADAWGQAWQTLASALGEARNWDVLVSETLPPIEAAFPDYRPLNRLRAEGRRRARRAYAEVAGMFALADYPRLITEFTAGLFALEQSAGQPLTGFAVAQLNSRARRARKLAVLHGSLTPEERHRMRICFKKLRYTLEFFSHLLPRRRLKPYLATLAQLQDELGLINDHITAAELIKTVLGDNAKGPIQGWIAGRHALLIAELPESLDSWLAQRTPWKTR